MQSYQNYNYYDTLPNIAATATANTTGVFGGTPLAHFSYPIHPSPALYSASPVPTTYATTDGAVRKPIEITVPRSRQPFVPEPKTYVYPPPTKPLMERRPSKVEVPEENSEELMSHGLSSCPSSPTSPTTSEKNDSNTLQMTSENGCIPNSNKELPSQPTNNQVVENEERSKQPTYYSSDEEEDDEFKLDDEAILKELHASKRINIDDITLSDDDEEEEEESDYDSDGNTGLQQQDKSNYHSTAAGHQSSTTMKDDLPPIPIISAPGYSDDDEENECNKKTKLTEPMPPIPTICAPGYSDDEDEDDSDKGGRQHQRQTKTANSILDSIFYGVRCGGCDEPLSGQAITTSGKHWHPRCFKCQACYQNLEHIAFYEKEGLPYCALDYHELFSPRCDFCQTPIEEHLISALGKTYHAGHFFCRECGKPFDEDTNFLEHNGHAYCEKDYFKRFGKRCKGCEEIITGDFLVALGGDWHKECFVCADCGGSFTSSTFLMRGGKPYCEEHYHQQEKATLRLKKKSSLTSIRNNATMAGTLRNLPDIELLNSIKSLSTADDKGTEQAPGQRKTCHRCRKSIENRCHSAFGFDYHPQHFQCSQCDKLLSARLTGLYQEAAGGEIICKPCARRSRKPLVL